MFPGNPRNRRRNPGTKMRKGSSKRDGDPRKTKKSSKFFALCDKHGGAKMTHNTGDCRKYDKNGTFKKDFKKGDLPDSTHRIETASHGPVEESGHPITSPLRIYLYVTPIISRVGQELAFNNLPKL